MSLYSYPKCIPKNPPIPKKDACPDCKGKGCYKYKHSFFGGWEYRHCSSCGGSGKKEDYEKRMRYYNQ